MWQWDHNASDLTTVLPNAQPESRGIGEYFPGLENQKDIYSRQIQIQVD